MEMNNKHYDVFINYRRNPGRDFARTLQQAFKARGFSVFFDYDSLQDGKFNEEIYSAIENCDVFIVSYSKGSLDRCENAGDWVRIEIEHAIKHGKKIIPVAPTELYSNLTFPANLPHSLKTLSEIQTTEIHSGKYFDHSIDDCIRERFPKGVVSNKAKHAEADSNEAERLFREGRGQEDGAYERCDMEKALECYRAAAEMGHPDAQFEVGSAYSEGWGGRVRDMDLAVEWWKKAVAGGSPDAMYALADLYTEGNVFEKDEGRADELYKNAFSIWKRRADAGDPRAQRRLAECYEYGIGTAIDEQLSLTWYRKAAEGNDIWALLTLVDITRDRIRDSDNDEWEKLVQKTQSSLTSLAEKGNPWCQNKMGDIYSGFYGNVDINMDEAVRWYEKAAGQGVSSAMYHLGVRYLKGDGVDVDYQKANRLLSNAVQNGNESALYDYGICLLLGLGDSWDATDNNSRAAECFKNCAKLYDPEERSGIVGGEESYEILAKLNERIERSGDSAYALTQAECWFELAREHNSNGHPDVADNDMREAVDCFGLRIYGLKGKDALDAMDIQCKIAATICDHNATNKNRLLFAVQICDDALEWTKHHPDLKQVKDKILGIKAKASQNLGNVNYNDQGEECDMEEAAKWYRKAADLGDAYARYKLGWMYANGQGVPKDDAEAVKWCRRAAEQGHAAAQCYLGWMYADGRGVPKDQVKAVEWYTKAAEQGNDTAQNNLGMRYYNGNDGKKNYEEAVNWFRKAAEQGRAGAQYFLGRMYANGQGVPKDETEAMKWLRKAAEQGFAGAQCYLGRMYANGQGVPKDEAQAVEWYTKAADLGDAEAQYKLGCMYANGQGVPKDEAQAVGWYTKAAKQGNATAQNNLGIRFYNGNGVKKNREEAVNWFRKAAEQGFVEAQFNLARCYYSEHGVAKDYAEAARWLHQAAKQGDADAQLCFALMLILGRGVNEDPMEAEHWLRKAAEQGHKVASRIVDSVLSDSENANSLRNAPRWLVKLYLAKLL